VSSDDPPKRSSERRETLGPPVIPRGALVSVGCPRCESGESELGTHEVRVHASRLGGRHRLDTLSVFYTGRSQDLLVTRRALARRKSVAPPDAGRGWVEGETVRVYRIP
jgi:hypothetical protein